MTLEKLEQGQELYAAYTRMDRIKLCIEESRAISFSELRHDYGDASPSLSNSLHHFTEKDELLGQLYKDIKAIAIRIFETEMEELREKFEKL
jgi:hypothetical protein